MHDPSKYEDFIVNSDDVTNLIEIYATRIKSYPENRAYYRALSLQCGEYCLAAKRMGNPVVGEVVQFLFQITKLLEEKGVPAETRVMEYFIAEIHNIGLYIKNWFKDPSRPFQYESNHLPLFKNYVRQLSRLENHRADARLEQLVEDPFDEMESLGNFVDSFLDDFDDAFDAITVSGGAGAAAAQGHMELSQSEQDELEKLFLSISGAYIQPVKDFISELQGGSPDKAWIDMCMGSLRLLEDAGTKMSYEKVTDIVKRFKSLMIMAKSSTSSTISRDIRIQLLKEYANLSDLLPEAFATSDSHASRGTVRDTIIVNAILRKTPGIGPVSRNKLIAAGMNSLDKYFVANPRDLAAVSGLTESQAILLCQTFQEYRKSLEVKKNLSSTEQVSLLKLFKLVKELKSLHVKFREITRTALHEEGHEDDLNQVRLDRQKCMWEINIVLAELDAFGMVEDFRKMVYDRRIERIDDFIQTKADKVF